ncbi:MAG: aldo/keto reductase [Anaerolineae bacterium]|nr:aldo/keto reductase [Anaerolineae bacterium]
MNMRQFGNTDLLCSPIGFGTWALGHGYGDIDDDQAARAMLAAIDGGINLIDTAEVYGPYLSEEWVGRTLGARRREIVLVTKVGYRYDAQGKIAGRNSQSDHLIAHTEDCLKRLQTDWIDLLLIHWPDHDTPLEETMRALELLKATGKVRYTGVSNFNVEMLTECKKHGTLIANQVGYNLFDRRMETHILPYCRQNGLGFMAYGSLCYGLLGGTFTPETTFIDSDWRSKGKAFGLPLFQNDHWIKELRVVDRLKALAARYDRTVAQLAIAWVIGHPAVTVALVGMRTVQELEEDIQAAEWTLSDDLGAEIGRIFQEEGVPTYVDAPQAV